MATVPMTAGARLPGMSSRNPYSYLEPTLSHQLYLILSYISMLFSLWYLLVRLEYTSKRYNR